jgi:predicted esterase
VSRPRIWVSHGTDDRVLPVDRCGRQVVRTLREAGYDVRYEEFEGGHDITPQLVADALTWWRSSAIER